MKVSAIMNLILLGFSNSGKSTMASYLSQKYNFSIYEISKYVMKEYNNQTQYKTPIEFCDNCFLNGYLTKFTQIMIQDAILDTSNKVFVGPRSIEEMKIINDFFSDVQTVGILADYRLRATRHVISSRSKVNNGTLMDRDIIECKWGLKDRIILQSEYVIDNSKDLDTFYRCIDNLILSYH